MNKISFWMLILMVAWSGRPSARGESGEAPAPDKQESATVPDPYDPMQLSPMARGMLAQVSEWVQKQDWVEAEAVARRMIERFPDSQPAYSMLTAILIEQQRYEDVLALFEEVMAAFPGDYRLMNNYAWFLATATNPTYRNPAKALALAQDSVLIAPNVFNVWSTLAEAHYINGNFERASRALGQCLELAVRQRAPESSVQNYRRQLLRMQEAAAIMSLVE